MASALDVKPFKSIDLNPGATLQQFTKYIEELELLFELVFRKADGTPYTPSEGGGFLRTYDFRCP